MNPQISQKISHIPHKNMSLITRSTECYVYGIPGAEGTMTCYDVFPGIQLCYNDFQASEKLPEGDDELDMMEINYCHRGRHECKYQDNTYSYIGEGDLIANMSHHPSKESRFPLGRYEGITIYICCEPAAVVLSTFLNGVNLDLFALYEKLQLHTSCFYLPSNESVKHIFAELYTLDPQIRTGYFKIKIVELLLFLSSDRVLNSKRELRYFPRTTVEAVDAIKEQITKHYQKHITMEELARTHSISKSALKNCFHEVYGQPVYAYLKQYRVQLGAELLRNTDHSIAFIANNVGYESASKFAVAFKSVMGCTPSEYRKVKNHLE